MDTFWANYEHCLNRITAHARTADTLIAILNEHYTPSSGAAFFPGGGDRDLRGTLIDCGWRVHWSLADYWFAICEPESNEGITCTEGDIDPGVGLPPAQPLARACPAYFRCPTDTHHSDGTPHTIIGCGAVILAQADDDGLIDCSECGIWFNPADERRTLTPQEAAHG